MSKPRVIIADTDVSFFGPLQLKFVEDFFERIDLESITNQEFYEQMFSVPQQADLLIVSEQLYNQSIHRPNIAHIFTMTEQKEEEQTAHLKADHIYKYTSIIEIFNEITGKSADVLNLKNERRQETQVILVYSASGGAGKTTIAMGMCASLSKNYKKVLYINVITKQKSPARMIFILFILLLAMLKLDIHHLYFLYLP